ncbi:MAG: hypothetical protein KAY37_05290 [Phycisphaerae bacterium]|nr:hypothetical protein [Phycisphaerae bacterium]
MTPKRGARSSSRSTCQPAGRQAGKKARHQLGRYSKPFPAANAHFVPWEHTPELIEKEAVA